MGTRPAFASVALSAAFSELSPNVTFASLESHKIGGIVRVPREIDQQSIVAMGNFLPRYGAIEFARAEDTWGFLADGSGTYETVKGIVQIARDNTKTQVLAATKIKPSDATLADFRTLRTKVNKAALNGRISAYQSCPQHHLPIRLPISCRKNPPLYLLYVFCDCFIYWMKTIAQQREEVKALAKRLGACINPSCGPLYFSAPANSATDMLPTNGSFGLVDTGKRKLLVTNQHVLKYLREKREKDPRLRTFVCLDAKEPVALFEDSQLIDEDDLLDIATFDAQPILSACSGRVFFPLMYPVKPVTKADLIILIGYQGLFRTAGVEGIQFGHTVYLSQVANVDAWRFQADITHSETTYNRLPDNPPRPDSSPHGGISGSPCFLLPETERTQLVGFVKQDFRMVGTDYLDFTHASCLNVDGTLNRPPARSF